MRKLFDLNHEHEMALFSVSVKQSKDLLVYTTVPSESMSEDDPVDPYVTRKRGYRRNARLAIPKTEPTPQEGNFG